MKRCATCLSILLLLMPLLQGCIYTNTIVPLDKDLQETQLGNRTGRSSYQSILWMVAWGDAGTQAAARDGGITTLQCADMEILSILFGLYYKETTIVYGN